MRFCTFSPCFRKIHEIGFGIICIGYMKILGIKECWKVINVQYCSMQTGKQIWSGSWGILLLHTKNNLIQDVMHTNRNGITVFWFFLTNYRFICVSLIWIQSVIFFSVRFQAGKFTYIISVKYHCTDEMIAAKPGFCLVQKSNRNLASLLVPLLVLETKPELH